MIFKDDEIGVAFADGGLWEVADFLKKPRHQSYLSRSMYGRATNELHGGLTFEGAIRTAQEGWHDGVELVHDLMSGVPLLENMVGVADWRYDACGEMPDVPRYVSGDPLHMRRRTRQSGSRPIIHIVVNTALVGGSTPTQQTNYGVALCGLIDWLEAKGKRVELDRVGVVDDGLRRTMQGWKVKRATDALDLPAVVFALAHMASHRHLVWGMRERMQAVGWTPVRVKQSDVEHFNADGALIIDCVLGDGLVCNTVAGACLLAAQRLNDAAGEDICDIEELARTLGDFV